MKFNKNREYKEYKPITCIVVVIIVVLATVYAVAHCFLDYTKITFKDLQKGNVRDNERVELITYLSPIMKEDYSLGYLCQTPYCYEISNHDKPTVLYTLKEGTDFGYAEGIIKAKGHIQTATKNNYDIISAEVNDDVYYIEKDKATEEDIKKLEDEGAVINYLFTDGSGNTTIYKMDDAVLDTIEDSPENDRAEFILSHGYVDIVNELLKDISGERIQNPSEGAEITESSPNAPESTQSGENSEADNDTAKISEGTNGQLSANEGISENQGEMEQTRSPEVSRVNAYQLLEDIDKGGYNVPKINDVLHSVIEIHEEFSQKGKTEDMDTRAEAIYSAFVDSFEELAVK